jgi:hypothetical protein
MVSDQHHIQMKSRQMPYTALRLTTVFVEPYLLRKDE